jgi:hypothetical protein
LCGSGYRREKERWKGGISRGKVGGRGGKKEHEDKK